MTVIAFDGHTLAGDKRANYGNLQRTTTKIFRIQNDRVGHLLVATSGSSAQGKEMINWISNGMNPDTFPSTQRDSKEYCSTLIVFPNGVKWSFERTPFPLVLEDEQVAIGSGRDFALAAMHMGASAKRACEVACYFDTSCGNGVDTLSFL